MDKRNVSVITEQGFVAGTGLGVQPVAEGDLHPDKKEEDEEKK